MSELQTRRLQTSRRFQELQDRLTKAELIADGKACVYVTGSFGRGEASSHSDLDIFILGKTDNVDPGKRGSQLKRLDDICIKAELIQATRELRFPEFSGDGKYLVHYSVRDLTAELGSQEDDFKNTFTARLLLLLESKPIIGQPAYSDCVEQVVNAYWRDWEGHSNCFVPAFLANDILRLWRTLCVDYEERTLRSPVREKAKGKLRNYKLKHSRMLTCYSALLYLLARYIRNKNTVTKQDALEMISLTPTERIEALLQETALHDAHGDLQMLLDRYEYFLGVTDAEENSLVDLFSDRAKSEAYLRDAFSFGDIVFDILRKTGSGTRFHRLLVV